MRLLLISRLNTNLFTGNRYSFLCKFFYFTSNVSRRSCLPPARYKFKPEQTYRRHHRQLIFSWSPNRQLVLNWIGARTIHHSEPPCQFQLGCPGETFLIKKNTHTQLSTLRVFFWCFRGPRARDLAVMRASPRHHLTCHFASEYIKLRREFTSPRHGPLKTWNSFHVVRQWSTISPRCFRGRKKQPECYDRHI